MMTSTNPKPHEAAREQLRTIAREVVSDVAGDRDEAMRRLRKRLAEDPALSSALLDGLLEDLVWQAVRGAARINGTPPAAAPASAPETRAGLERKGERVLLEMLLWTTGAPLGNARKSELLAEIAAHRAEMAQRIEMIRFLDMLADKLTSGSARVRDVFNEVQLARLHAEAKSGKSA